MSKRMTKFFLTLTGIFGLTEAFAADIYPFFLQRQDGTVLEGYFSPPGKIEAPIVFAIQGSSCESVLEWHRELSDQMNALGLGLIVLEKQGISKEGINSLIYNQTNCIQHRLEDYTVCLENAHLICPGWEGKPIFWGESEGGMLAAALASQTPETAAVLLFGTGGGMKPREEVKWTIEHHLEKQGAMEDEINDYMSFLDEQMDAMILNPSSEKQFLGNTYKWWASFLAAEKAVAPLNQRALPICLIHGAEDSQIPVISADLAAENLAKTNALTYLRLNGYGHDLDTAEVRDAVSLWLASILFGQEPLNSTFIAQVDLPASVSLENAQIGMSEYVFSRGKGEASASVEASTDSRGNDRLSGDVSVSKEFDNGVSVDVSAGGSVSKDRGGNVQGEAHGRASISLEY